MAYSLFLIKSEKHSQKEVDLIQHISFLLPCAFGKEFGRLLIKLGTYQNVLSSFRNQWCAVGCHLVRFGQEFSVEAAMYFCQGVRVYRE